MAYSETTRLALAHWTSGTDNFLRTQLDNSFQSLESKAAGFLTGTRPAAAAQYAGFIHFNTTSRVLSYCDGSSWYEMNSFATPGNQAIGDVAAEGSALTSARSDHTHGMPSFATAVDVTTSSGAGSGTTVARANHTHKIGAGAINNSNMFSTNVVDANALDPAAVGEATIADGAVTTNKLADNAVTNLKMADNSVDSAELVAQAVVTSKIATAAVTDAKISDVAGSKVTGTIGTAQVPSLDASKITTGSFATGRIPSLDASKITTGEFSTARIPSLPSSKIDAGAVTNAKLAASGLSASKLTTGTLPNDQGPLEIQMEVDGIAGTGKIWIDDGAPTGGGNNDIWFEY